MKTTSRTKPAAATALVVDDEVQMRRLLRIVLEGAGYRVVEAVDGASGLREAAQFRPDVILLDLGLPDQDGAEVLRQLRAWSATPVLILSVREDPAEKVEALDLGADDYVTKPFSPRELVLRVESVLRRARGAGPVPTEPGGPGRGNPTGRRLVDGDLELDLARHSATLAGEPLALTGREFDLLAFLLQHPGVAYSREDLLREVWGWDFGDRSTVTVHVRRLRTKVEPEPAEPVRLVTVWGVGYRWDPAP